MKKMILILLAPWVLNAQTVEVDTGDTENEGYTSVEIKKSKTPKSEAQWEVHDGTADIDGGEAAMEKEARETWKKSCDDWKKEFRTDNKDNKIISMSCGSPACSGSVGKKNCTSKASFKVKTKIN